MDQLTDVLKAIGPNASIIFAAWIFMGFLQQRYDGAITRYRDAVGDYRSAEHEGDRASNLKSQVLLYRRRCKLMAWATLVGLIAAILIISSLLFGALDAIAPKIPLIIISGTIAAIAGFALVIVAALIVIVEGLVVSRQIDDELRDVPDLANEAGQQIGKGWPSS